ncbi:hypothetical protein [Roseicyclus sp.]|uniref:hypothetical protein n=1 Tax=Roseicyclus sp. TaxID=1914329 RepID=UPI003F69B8E4
MGSDPCDVHPKSRIWPTTHAAQPQHPARRLDAVDPRQLFQGKGGSLQMAV